MSISSDLQSIPRLFGDVVEQLGKLISSEVQLAKAELSQKLTQAGMGVGFIAMAGILVVPVLVLALIALALWLGQLGLSPPLAHLAAAGVGAVIAGILAAVGSSYLKPKNLTPDVTIQQVGRDVQTAKELAK